MDDITALDLLEAMVRIAPGGDASKNMGLALDGYLAAHQYDPHDDGQMSPKDALKMQTQYQRGYFCCNQNSMTPSERQAEILGLMSIMIIIEQETSC